MKISFLLILLTCFISCKDYDSSPNDEFSHRPITDSLGITNTDTSAYLNNDTFCMSRDKLFGVHGVEIVQACHVFYSVTESKKYIELFTTQQMPLWSNFELGDTDNLTYVQNDSILSVRILFLSKIRNVILIPDSVFFHNNILYLKEKEQLLNDKKSMRDFMFEEFYYELKISKGMKGIVIRHKT